MTNTGSAAETDGADIVNVQLDRLDADDRAALEQIAAAEGVDLGQVILDCAVQGLHGRSNINNGSAGTLVQTHTFVGDVAFP
ncbi:hypothetical protein SAMN02982929_03428 [Saccharopolyspora kobensis]|uniref:Uncharacterized protein n=1 Tax=Saccharopolyspora kobensis TaxID=146035 RepID=A0A1H6CRK4_9PSEU|nr:hypothetical protein [Saccharopolyspora kobensis]SEG75273.1 hypothetical protein SAMN02982929_03428 [Saccharopolyspora kobensis]SFC95873.1 hypothetical protein SAMN05216506_10221 [Saccharopolyspora kobensis]